MLFSVKTPPFGKRSTTGTLTIFCPRLESHKTPAQGGEWVTKAGISSISCHSLTSLHSPATWLFSEQRRGLCCSDSTNYITLQLTSTAVNTPNVMLPFKVLFSWWNASTGQGMGQGMGNNQLRALLHKVWFLKAEKSTKLQYTSKNKITLVQGLSNP